MNEPESISDGIPGLPDFEIKPPYKLWRDGRFLVAETRLCKFPKVCVKTAETNDLAFYNVYRDLARGDAARTLGPLAGMTALALGGRVRVRVATGAALGSERRPLMVSVAKWWLNRRQRYGLVGKLIMGCGVLTALVGTVVYALQTNARADQLALAIPGLGIAIIIAGCVYLTIAYGLVLSPNRHRGQYTWFQGAHPDFLATLPAWDPALLKTP